MNGKQHHHRRAVALSAGTAPIPQAGPIVLFCGQEFEGGRASDILAAIFEVRRDTRIVAGDIAPPPPATEDLCWYVDPVPWKPARLANYRPLKRAVEWLRNGHCLLVFPTSEFTHWTATGTFLASRPWSPALPRIIRSTRAWAAPVAAGPAAVRMGQPVRWDSLAGFPSDKDILAHLHGQMASLERTLGSVGRLVPRIAS